MTVEAYIDKASESIMAAKLLLDEKFMEFATSRAYYAMFYLASALLLTRELSFSSHKAVIANFGREFAKTGLVPAEYHRYLIDAQQIRNIADYRGTPITAEEAHLQIERAEAFLETVKLMLDENG